MIDGRLHPTNLAASKVAMKTEGGSPRQTTRNEGETLDRSWLPGTKCVDSRALSIPKGVS